MKRTPYSDRIRHASLRAFGGLVNPDRAADGEIVDMENLSSEHYPVLAPQKRGTSYEYGRALRTVGYFDEKTYYISGTGFYYDGEKITTVTDGEKTVLQFPGKLVILPDKIMIKHEIKYYRADANNYVYETTGILDDETPVDIIKVVNNGNSFNEITKPTAKKAGDLFIHNRAKDGQVLNVPNPNRIYSWNSTSGEWEDVGEPNPYVLYRLKTTKWFDLKLRMVFRKKKISISTCNSEGNIVGKDEYSSDDDSLMVEDHIKITFEDDESFFKSKFEVGDIVKVLGVKDDGEGAAEISGGMVISKIDKENKRVIFENPKNVNVHAYNSTMTLEITRLYPDFDGAFVHENRLWGWKGSTIYASSLGEPEKIFNYSLLSTSPWSVDTLGDKICAGISYDGFPVFFKRNSIIKVYGDTASEFSTREFECTGMGVDTVSRGSLAICAGHLMYNSPRGIMKYSGGYPSYIGDGVSHLLGSGGIGASDGRRYYLSFPDKSKTFVFDTMYGHWHKRTTGYDWFFTLENSLLGVRGGWIEAVSGEYVALEMDAANRNEEEFIPSMAEFAYITEGSLFRKTYNRLRIRLQVFSGKLEILASYDDSKPRVVLSVEADKSPDREVRCVDLLAHRCDTLKLYVRGTGDYRIYSIDREFTVDDDEI